MRMGLDSPDSGQLLMTGFGMCGVKIVSSFFTAIDIIS